jgi:hypothetical protein
MIYHDIADWPRKEKDKRRPPRVTRGQAPTSEPIPRPDQLPPDVVETVLSAYAREVALDPGADPVLIRSRVSRASLPGVPVALAEAARVLVFNDLVNGTDTDKPIDQRIAARIDQLDQSKRRPKQSEEREDHTMPTRDEISRALHHGSPREHGSRGSRRLELSR